MVEIEVDDAGVLELIELALILTLISDGLVVERELLGRHWGPPARALVFAMPITLACSRCGAKLLFSELSWAEAFLLGAVLSPDRPRRHLDGRHRAARAGAHPPHAQPRVRPQRRARAALRPLLPRPRRPRRRRRLRGRSSCSARRRSAPWSGSRSACSGAWFIASSPAASPPRYEGIYAIGFGLVAFGLADVTFGNGLIAAFVAGITLGYSEHEITERFAGFSENVSAIFQVLTFFVFGAIIVATGYDGPICGPDRVHPLRAPGRPTGRGHALAAGTDCRRPQKAFIAWFGPKGVASMLFALLVLDAAVANGLLVFDVAAFVILASILAHGLTDTVGARWIERRMRRS